ncbi:hypothetical protein T11_7099 [Trichinella zimbabwensis]|uniref:Uncharacterized protein n=1 Tax=Trichinella zimbabwensis TaxID=268475 RepID=A0A0V1I495_9BILA|nr:hypothetical protein T11_7099 [Trichinella zimbabwensis]
MSKQRNIATVWIGRNSVPAVLLSNVEGAATSALWPQLHVLSHMPVPIQLLGLIDGVGTGQMQLPYTPMRLTLLGLAAARNF